MSCNFHKKWVVYVLLVSVIVSSCIKNPEPIKEPNILDNYNFEDGDFIDAVKFPNVLFKLENDDFGLPFENYYYFLFEKDNLYNGEDHINMLMMPGKYQVSFLSIYRDSIGIQWMEMVRHKHVFGYKTKLPFLTRIELTDIQYKKAFDALDDFGFWEMSHLFYGCDSQNRGSVFLECKSGNNENFISCRRYILNAKKDEMKNLSYEMRKNKADSLCVVIQNIANRMLKYNSSVWGEIKALDPKEFGYEGRTKADRIVSE